MYKIAGKQQTTRSYKCDQKTLSINKILILVYFYEGLLQFSPLHSHRTSPFFNFVQDVIYYFYLSLPIKSKSKHKLNIQSCKNQ